MYPDKVGRMIFDGVYNGNNYRAALWNSNVIGSEAVINSIFTFCHQAGPDGCALYESTPAAIRERFFDVLDSVRQNRVPIPLAHGFPYVVGAIHAVESANQTLLTQLVPYIISPVACNCASPPPPNNNDFDALHAGPQTLDREAYKKFFEDIVHRAPTLGPIWATYHLECTQWPVRPKWRYTGELAATNLSHPILIVEPKFDPAGPLHDALEVRKRYAGTGLLIQNSYGHTSVAAPSACTAKYVREYLEARTMPGEGTVCQPDVLLLVGPVKIL